MKVAIIDSGKGGKYIASKLEELGDVETVQWEPCFFRSYSKMTMDDLISTSDAHIKFAKEQQVDAVVIGCMTLSTNLTLYIRRQLDSIPVYDLYEFLPKFDEQTLVLGTVNTIRSGKFDNYQPVACHELSSAIENNFCELIEGLLRGYEGCITYLRPYKRVILGCSHYSIKREVFETYFKEAIIIDPVEYLLKILNEKINVVDPELISSIC